MDPVDYLLELVKRPENLAVVIATWAIVGAYRKMFPAASRTAIAARIEPALPLVVAEILVWIPGAVPADMATGSKVVLGIILGWGAAWGHKALGQSVQGRDDRIKPEVLR